MPFIFWSLQRDFLNLLWCSSSLDNLIIHCVWSGIFRFLIFTQIAIKFRTSVYSPAYLCLLSRDCLYLHIGKAMACHFASAFSLAQRILSWYLNLDSVAIHSAACTADRVDSSVVIFPLMCWTLHKTGSHYCIKPNKMTINGEHGFLDVFQA